MSKEYVHKSIPELHAQYRRQAQKVTLTYKNGRKYYLFNWFGLIFFVNNKMKYRPNRDLIKYASPMNINDWYSRVNRNMLHHFPEQTPVNLSHEERLVAKSIAKQLKKDPLLCLTKKQKANVLDILRKREEHKKWMEAKGEELKERYKRYTKASAGSPPVPLMLLIELSGLFVGNLSSIYKKIDAFHKENIEGKRLTKSLKQKERDFLEALEREAEFDAEAEHMAMI